MMNSPRLSARFSRDRDGNLLCLSERANAATATNDAADDPRQLQQASFFFVLVGIGYLFPFSALTQPVDYWNMLFPDFNIEFPLTCIYMFTNLVMLALLVFCGADGSPSFTPRIVGGFVGQLLVLVFVPTSYFFYLSESYNEVAVLGATAVAAIVTAFIDSSVIALSSQYPLRVQEYFQLGVGISTLIGSIYRDVTKAVFPADMLVESSLLYFYSGAVTIGVCIAAYYKLLQLPLSKRCLAAAVEEAKRHSDATITPLDAQAVGESLPLLGATITSPAPVSKRIILRKIFYNEMMVLLLFMSTLALWPPLVTEIPAYAPFALSLQASGWWSLLLLTVFSILDCVGRIVVRYRGSLTRHNIWMAVAGRCCLFPLIICSIQGKIFTHDTFSVLFVALLGFTNGYVGTLTIVMVNKCVSEKEQAIAGSFTSFFLNTGLVLGASIGLFLDKILERPGGGS